MPKSVGQLLCLHYRNPMVDWESECRAAWDKMSALSSEGAIKDAKIEELRRFIDLQAEDEGLWFVAQTAPEAVVQRGLRGCHMMFEQLFTVSTLQKCQCINRSGRRDNICKDCGNPVL